MFRFIFYVILFYLTVKALNAFFRWLKAPRAAGGTTSGTTSGGTNRPYSTGRYKDIEEAEFTEIETPTQKEKAQEKS